MATHVALLRGVNVGGRKVAMADLRQVVASLGHTGIATYIQSGNVLFTARGAGVAATAGGGGADAAGQAEVDNEALASDLERACAAVFGFQPAVVVLSRGDLARVVRDNPYPGEPNPKYVHAVFFRGELSLQTQAAVAAAEQRAAERGGRDEAHVAGRALYLHTPDGFGRSELAAQLLGRSSSPVAAGTARNWATVTKLLALCGES